MATLIWTTLAIGALLALFVVCVVAVAAGIRVLEHGLDRRRERPSA